MPLSYNITSVLSISNANANVNALSPETTATDAYEMAFVGVANFLSGNYIQNSAAVNDIKSNVAVSATALNNAHFFYVSNVDTDNSASYPGGGESAYGNNIAQTGTIFGSAAVNSVAMSNNDAVVIGDFADFGNEYIAMTSIAAGSGDTVVDSGDKKLLAGQSSVGDGLLQAVSAALFKKLGKNAALLNDSDLITDLNTKFHTALQTEMVESAKAYGDSKMFKRYLETGRYQNDGGDLNSDIAYNLNDTVVNMVINISGHVNDADGGPDLSANTDAINQIFGTVGTDHKISVTSGTEGIYDIKVFVQLKHDERF
jgi:hypothetical protein